jgi:hypothetical protein
MSSYDDGGWSYLGIGQVLGGIAGFLTFVGGWLYCVSEYGFLLGGSLGWIPSAIAAGIVGAAVTFLWGPVLVLVVVGFLISQQQRSEVRSAEEAAVLAADAAATESATSAADAALAAADAAADAASAAADAAARAPNDWTPFYTVPGQSGPYVVSRGTADCTIDCSGHEAGYAWAEEKGIDDAADCGGNSQSFIEGCEAYVEDNY